MIRHAKIAVRVKATGDGWLFRLGTPAKFIPLDDHTAEQETWFVICHFHGVWPSTPEGDTIGHSLNTFFYVDTAARHLDALGYELIEEAK